MALLRWSLASLIVLTVCLAGLGWAETGPAGLWLNPLPGAVAPVMDGRSAPAGLRLAGGLGKLNLSVNHILTKKMGQKYHQFFELVNSGTKPFIGVATLKIFCGSGEGRRLAGTAVVDCRQKPLPPKAAHPLMFASDYESVFYSLTITDEQGEAKSSI